MKTFDEFIATTIPIPQEVKDVLYGDGSTKLVTNFELHQAWYQAYKKYKEDCQSGLS